MYLCTCKSFCLFEGDTYLEFFRNIFSFSCILCGYISCISWGEFSFPGHWQCLVKFSARWPFYQTKPLLQLELSWVSHPLVPHRWAQFVSDIHSPPRMGRWCTAIRLHYSALEYQACPVKVIKKSTGLDMCPQSERTTSRGPGQQTEAVSIMAKMLEVSISLYFFSFCTSHFCKSTFAPMSFTMLLLSQHQEHRGIAAYVFHHTWVLPRTAAFEGNGSFNFMPFSSCAVCFQNGF